MYWGMNQRGYCGSPVGKTAIMDNYVQALGEMPDVRMYVSCENCILGFFAEPRYTAYSIKCEHISKGKNNARVAF